MNSLKQIMKVNSQKPNLGIVYTNRSIRATSVTILDQTGLEACDIMTTSGHPFEKSIQHYNRTGFNKKRLCQIRLKTIVPLKNVNAGEMKTSVLILESNLMSLSSMW